MSTKSQKKPSETRQDSRAVADRRPDRAIEGVTNLPTNEKESVNTDNLLKPGSELYGLLKEIFALFNENTVAAANAGSAPSGVEQRPGRLARALLSPEAFDEALKAPRPELDLEAADPAHGYIPDQSSYVSNKPHKGRNVITIVTRGVKSELFSAGFNDVVKHMLELAPHSITGLTTGFCLNPLDGVLQDNSVSPELTVVERHGRPYDRALTEWARRYNDYMRDKKTSFPASQRAGRLQEEDVTIDLFFIEPDESGKHVLAAWHGTNIRPSTYCGLQSVRNLHGSISKHNLSISLGGVFKHSESVLEAAQKELDQFRVEAFPHQSTPSGAAPGACAATGIQQKPEMTPLYIPV